MVNPVWNCAIRCKLCWEKFLLISTNWYQFNKNINQVYNVCNTSIHQYIIQQNFTSCKISILSCKNFELCGKEALQELKKRWKLKIKLPTCRAQLTWDLIKLLTLYYTANMSIDYSSNYATSILKKVGVLLKSVLPFPS